MANSGQLQGGEFTDSHGNNCVYDSDVDKKICSLCGRSRKCQNEYLPHLEGEEPEKLDKAEGNSSEIEQLKLKLEAEQLKGKLREVVGKLKEKNKLTVLRQASSDFKNTDEGKLLGNHVMSNARYLFRDTFPWPFCKGFAREVNIRVFQSNNRGKFLTDPEAVMKTLRTLCSRGGEVDSAEFKWRKGTFDDSDVALDNLKTAVRCLVLTEAEMREFKLRWDKSKLEEYYYLCKAAAEGNEKAHCVLDSPELNVNGLADSEELIYEEHNLGDLVKDIAKLGHGNDHHKQPDVSPYHPPACPLQTGRGRGGRGSCQGLPSVEPSASRVEPHCPTSPVDALPPPTDDSGLQRQSSSPVVEFPPLSSNAGLQGPAVPPQQSSGYRDAVLAPARRDGLTGAGRGGLMGRGGGARTIRHSKTTTNKTQSQVSSRRSTSTTSFMKTTRTWA